MSWYGKPNPKQEEKSLAVEQFIKPKMIIVPETETEATQEAGIKEEEVGEGEGPKKANPKPKKKKDK